MSGGLIPLSRPTRQRRATARFESLAVATVLATAALLTSCVSDDGVAAPTIASYVGEMSAICDRTQGGLEALGTPPTEISTFDFASEVARFLTIEADAARVVRAPDSVDDDHRAYVLNTDEQSAAWQTLADLTQAGEDTSDTESLVSARTRIGELTLGRDDLAASMGLDACRVQSG